MSPKAPKAPKGQKAPKEKEEAEVTCPVCAGIVTLDDPFCPHCGAEFEEEEVEEVIEEDIPTIEAVHPAPEPEEIELEPESEVLDFDEPKPEIVKTKFDDEKVEAFPSDAPEEPFEVPFEAPAEAPAAEEGHVEELFPELEAEPVRIEEDEDEINACPPPAAEKEADASSLTDLRVIGIAMLMLGIIGAIVMSNIRWFWLWVPAIQGNVLPYALVGIAIILLSFIFFRKMAVDKDKGKAPMHPMLPSVMLSLILFGFMTIVLFMISNQITQALKSSQIGVSSIFVVLVVVGFLIYLSGSRTKNEASAEKA